MSEEILCGEDKDELRRRLELLQKEYERTAQRLQRAERREAVRRHVQKTVSDQNQLLQIDTPAALDRSSSSSSELLSNQPPESTKVRFDLPDGSGASPFPSLRCRRSPSLRLRSKRSRLRLQVRAKESDAEPSQEKRGEGEEGAGETRRTEERDGVGTENLPGVESAGGQTEEEKKVETSPEVSSADPHAPSDVSGSCTLIEGLLFPAEYYVRTTRRMASARSPVDVDAVVLSQLYRGRRRQRSPKPHASAGGHVTPVQKPRRRGQRGRRGRGRARDPSAHRESRPAGSNPGTDFKRLPDSQLYLDPPGTQEQGIERTNVPRLLPRLTSLDRVLSVFEVRDFHLPDEEFGRLKLERLRAAGSNLEPLVYGSGRGSGRNGARRTESERFLPCSTTFESQLISAGQSQSETGRTEGRDDGETSRTRLMLNLSMSSTSRTQVSPGPSLISVGESPGQSVPPSPSRLESRLISSERDGSGNPEEHAKPRSEQEESGFHLGRTASETRDRHRSCDESEPELKDAPVIETQACYGAERAPGLSESSPGLGPHPRFGPEAERVPDSDASHRVNVNGEILFSPEEGLVNGFSMSPEDEALAVSGRNHGSGPEVQTRAIRIRPEPERTGPPDEVLSRPGNCGVCPETNSGTKRPPPTRAEPEGHADPDATLGDGDIHPSPVSIDDPARPTGDERPGLSSRAEGTGTDATGAQISPERPCGALQKTHTLKALDGCCVLDVCLVRWSPDDWCVCVAGEWSVCVWAREAQRWDLRHTWTFTQSVISLQEVPDTLGLLCISLGRLEIVEARILCCPGVDGPFSQADLCRDDLQAVLAVSACRVTCCSSPEPRQVVQVFTLARDGRAVETRPLASSHHSVRTLAVVEGEKDALLGWTEREVLLVWNMKSGQLLQTVRLSETASTATCLRGYSYRGRGGSASVPSQWARGMDTLCSGVLCVLLQRAGACDEARGSALFTLMATNPLTGKHLTLTSITNPTADAERLTDGDTCESALVGVFQSGHLAVWDLRGSVSCVYSEKHTDVCRLARWAGPDLLLTGYLNGNVSLYQYKPV